MFLQAESSASNATLRGDLKTVYGMRPWNLAGRASGRRPVPVHGDSLLCPLPLQLLAGGFKSPST